jgi:hypothetical protein
MKYVTTGWIVDLRFWGKYAGVGQGIEERIKNHREWRITVSLIPKHIGGV